MHKLVIKTSGLSHIGEFKFISIPKYSYIIQIDVAPPPFFLFCSPNLFKISYPVILKFIPYGNYPLYYLYILSIFKINMQSILFLVKLN